MIPAALTILQLCFNQYYICESPDPPPIAYYQEGYACYINGTFHQSCPKPDYLTKPTTKSYNRNNY